MESFSWGILLIWPTHLSWDFSIQRISNGPTSRDFQISELRTWLYRVTLSILCKKTHFGRLPLRSHSFGHYIWFINITISENEDKNCFDNWEHCLFRKFAFDDNRIVKSSNYCTNLANSDIQFFALPSVTRGYNPKILELLYLLLCRSFYCNTPWPGFHERWSISVLAVLCFIPMMTHASVKLFNASWRPDFCGRKQNQIISK